MSRICVGDRVTEPHAVDPEDRAVVGTVLNTTSTHADVEWPGKGLHRIDDLANVPATTVGQWARIVECQIPEAVGLVGRVVKGPDGPTVHSGVYRPAGWLSLAGPDGSRDWHYSVPPGGAVLVRPRPVAPTPHPSGARRCRPRSPGASATATGAPTPRGSPPTATP